MFNVKRKILYVYIKILEIFINICCVFIINRKKRNFFRKDKKTKIREIYLKKYVDMYKNFEYIETDDNIVKKIWIFWMQGEISIVSNSNILNIFFPISHSCSLPF